MFILTILASLLFSPQEISLNEVEQLKSTDSEVTRVYLVRHGESAFNIPDANGVKYTSGKSLSIPLTPTGEEQAKELGHKLNTKLDKNSDYLVLSSTALRAQKTADLIFNELKNNYSIERGNSFHGFCELGQGDWEGKPKNHHYEEALKFWESLSAKEKFFYPKINTGESYSEVANRYIADLQQVLDEYPNKTIVIVSHFAAMNAFTLQMNNLVEELSEKAPSSLPSIRLSNCDILLLEISRDKTSQEFRVTTHIMSDLED